METCPLAIFLVKNGSNGDKMLFKYPFEFSSDQAAPVKNSEKQKNNQYSVGISQKSTVYQTPLSVDEDFSTTKLSQFEDKDLSHLLAVNKKLCGDRFELKINDIRFVGHPISLELSCDTSKERTLCPSTILIFHIVFALKVSTTHEIVNCYHDLSKRLGVAINFEEQRCSFLSEEAKIMLSELDETHQPETERSKTVFQRILSKSTLAEHLKTVFTDLCDFGCVFLRINNWIDFSFCMPQKIKLGAGPVKHLTHDVLVKGLETVKPYHAILLLRDRQDIMPMSSDVSPALRRILDVLSPINPLYTLASDADLTLTHVRLLAGHLVYWGMATVIFPVCCTNVYVLTPHVPTTRMNALREKFDTDFPHLNFHEILSEYNLPISVSDKCPSTYLQQEQQEENNILMWLLRQGLLQQLHTYVYITPISIPRIKESSLGISRGVLPPVVEDQFEKHFEDNSSTGSMSLREEVEWSVVQPVYSYDSGVVKSDSGSESKLVVSESRLNMPEKKLSPLIKQNLNENDGRLNLHMSYLKSQNISLKDYPMMNALISNHETNINSNLKNYQETIGSSLIKNQEKGNSNLIKNQEIINVKNQEIINVKNQEKSNSNLIKNQEIINVKNQEKSSSNLIKNPDKVNLKNIEILNLKNQEITNSNFIKNQEIISNSNLKHFILNQDAQKSDHLHLELNFEGFRPFNYSSLVSQSFTPSESEFDSICSDDRSVSPSGLSQATCESIHAELDLYLKPAEKALVLNVEASHDDFKMFANLCRFFRGEHHLEEIMYRANIQRSQLLEIIDKFRSVLITSQRIDPAVHLGLGNQY